MTSPTPGNSGGWRSLVAFLNPYNQFIESQSWTWFSGWTIIIVWEITKIWSKWALRNVSTEPLLMFNGEYTAAAAAKSLQLCPTLCDPIDGSPPGSSVPAILQARILEWVAISFSNASMHAKQPTRFLCPQDSPGKNTGVCCHFLLQNILQRGAKMEAERPLKRLI